jgi:hypothetical protein
MRKTLAAFVAALLSTSALAAATPGTVQQSGTVVPSHAAKWATTGVISDAGTSQTPGISTIGILSSNPCSFSINTALSPAPNTQLCFGVTGGATPASTIYLNSFGGANPAVLDFNINGSIYQFPFNSGGTLGPATTVIHDPACWNNLVGTLLADCKFLLLPYAPTLITSPTGNPTTGPLLSTYSTVAVQGTTGNPSNREFLVNLGLTSSTGQGLANSNGDKVTLYAGAVANSGSGNLWAFNPLLSQTTGSGNYDAQVIEVDMNNFNADRGGSDGPSGLPGIVAYGVSISGAGDSNNYTNTSALNIDSFGGAVGTQPLWAHGIIEAGFFKFNEFAEYGVTPTVFALFGSHTYGLDCNAAGLSVACIRLGTGSNGGLVARNLANTDDAHVLWFDGTNETIAGSDVGGVFSGAPILPLTANAYDLGGPTDPWNTLFVSNLVAISSATLNGANIISGAGITGNCAVWTGVATVGNSGSPCGGGGGGGVSSIIAGNGILVSPTTGAVTLRVDPNLENLVTLTVGSGSPAATITDYGTLLVTLNSVFHGGLQLTGIPNVGVPSAGLCLDSGDNMITCAGGAGSVASVTSTNTNIVVTPTTGAVTIGLIGSPILTSLGVGTTGITSTISDGGSLAVAGNATFAGGTSFTSATVQFTSLASGTPTSGLCLASGGFMILCSSAGSGVSQITAGSNIAITPSGGTGNVTVNLSANPASLVTLSVGTSSPTATITDGGTLAVAGGTLLSGSVQLTGLSGGTPIAQLCLAASGFLISCGGTTGVTSLTNTDGNIVFSASTGPITANLNPVIGGLTSLVVGSGAPSAAVTINNGTGASLSVSGTSKFTGAILSPGVTVAALPVGATNGTMIFATDGAPGSSPCTGSSTGAMAFRENTAWKCF